MKSLSKLLCVFLVAILCVSLVACTRTRIETDWVPVSNSDAQSGDDNVDNEVETDDAANSDAVNDNDDGSDNAEESDESNDEQGSVESDDTTVTQQQGQIENTTRVNKTQANKTQANTTQSDKTQANKTQANKTQSKNTQSNTQPNRTNSDVTTKASKERGNTDTVYRNITVKKGNTKLEDTVKSVLSGKTYTAIIWSEIKDGFKEEIDAFNEKYGCTVKMDTTNFENIGTTLATKLATGDAYDLIRMHGSWYPRYLTQGLLTPLEGAFTTADLTTDSNTVGIDLEKSKYFGWSNHLYAITGYDDSPMYYLYYNKRLLKGANDPMTLYKKGKWNWTTMKKVAANFTGPKSTGGAWFSDLGINYKLFPLSNGVSLLKETKKADGGVKLEVSISNNGKFFNALKFMQSLNGLGTGGSSIYEKKQVLAQSGSSAVFENLLNGTIAVWAYESNRYIDLYMSIRKSGSAFGNDVKNLGVAPVPAGVDNPSFVDGYPAGWLTGYAAGQGADSTAPQLVAAFTKFHCTYKSAGTTDLEKEAAAAYEKVKGEMDHLYKKLNYCDFGYGPTRTETMDSVLFKIEGAVVMGHDITKSLKEHEGTAENYLKSSLKQQ